MESSSDAATTAAIAWPARHLLVTVEGRDGTRTEIKVEKPFARIGRDRRAEVPLSDAAVLPCHAYLHAAAEGIYCAGLAPGAPNGWLLPTASLEIGGFRLHAAFEHGTQSRPTFPEPQSKNSAARPFPHIRIFSDKIATGYADVTLHRQLTIVGRQAPASWRIKHPTISRAHCALVWDGKQLWLIDLFSSNGTRLGGKRFDAGAVDVGQEFRLGMVRLCYLGTDVSGAPTTHGSLSDHAIAFSDVTDLSVVAPTVGDQPAEVRAQEVHVQNEPAFALPPEQPASGNQQPLAAALVDTQLPSVGDTKFVESAPRAHGSPPPLSSPRDSDVAAQQAALAVENLAREVACERRDHELKLALMEEKLSAVAAEAASQRETVTTGLSRAAAELDTARQEIVRLEEELLQQQRLSAEQQALLDRESEQRLGSGLAELSDHTRKQYEQFERQARLDHEARDRQFAELRVTIAAEVAEWTTSRNFVPDELRTLAADLAQIQAALAALRVEVSHERKPLPAQQPGPTDWDARARELTEEIERRGEDLQGQIAHLQNEMADRTEEAREAIEQQLRLQRRTEDHLVELAKEVDRQVVAMERRLAQRRQSDAETGETTSRQRDEIERQFQLVQQTVLEQLGAFKSELLAEINDLQRQADELSRSQESLAAEFKKHVQEAEQRWETRFRDLTEQSSKCASEVESRSLLELQVDRERLAALDGSLTAKIAELRARQDELREHVLESLSPARSHREEFAPAEMPSVSAAPVEEEPADRCTAPESQRPSQQQAIVITYSNDEPLGSPRRIRGGTDQDLNSSPQEAGNIESAPTPDWVINDELTQRLLNFRSQRERTAWHRRLLWMAIAAVLVGLIVAAASVARLWISENAAESSPTDALNEQR